MSVDNAKTHTSVICIDYDIDKGVDMMIDCY
jgi:hypothetical protein